MVGRAERPPRAVRMVTRGNAGRRLRILPLAAGLRRLHSSSRGRPHHVAHVGGHNSSARAKFRSGPCVSGVRVSEYFTPLVAFPDRRGAHFEESTDDVGETDTNSCGRGAILRIFAPGSLSLHARSKKVEFCVNGVGIVYRLVTSAMLMSRQPHEAGRKIYPNQYFGGELTICKKLARGLLVSNW
jgi:hypothetical protein